MESKDMSDSSFFLKLDGIDGESQDAKHKGEIEVISWSWGQSQMGSQAGGGLGAGRVTMEDFHFIMKINKATPKLFLACATGKHFVKGVLTCSEAGKERRDYLKILFSDLLVSSFQISNDQINNVAAMQYQVETLNRVSLNFAKIEFEYIEQKPDGTLSGAIKAGFDLKQNKAI